MNTELQIRPSVVVVRDTEGKRWCVNSLGRIKSAPSEDTGRNESKKRKTYTSLIYPELSERLRKKGFAVDTIALTGSAASDVARYDSDVDLEITLEKAPSDCDSEDFLDLQAGLCRAVEETLMDDLVIRKYGTPPWFVDVHLATDEVNPVYLNYLAAMTSEGKEEGERHR